MPKSLLLILFASLIFVTSCAQKEPQDPEMVYDKFKSAENLASKIEILEEFKDTNPDNNRIPRMISEIVNGLMNNKGVKEASEYLLENKSFANSSNFNSLAWKIYESNKDLESGAIIAKIGSDVAREELENYEKTKPENRTKENWKKSKKNSLAMVLDTYGCIEKELNNNENALSIYNEAVKLTNDGNSEINENFISLLVKKGEYKKGQSLLEKYISAGTDSKNMKSLLKEVYVKNGNDASKFEAYLTKFEEQAKQKMIERLNKETRNDPAPDFELLDLDGKSVKLSDYKGKTVILDFWATWCGPCLRSFPAMKKAVEKFSSNKNVKFLFANTRERVDNKKENAANFIEKNNYPFHVLLDDQNIVYEKYGVRGIPTKFIIDKNQKIKFESIGYAGKEDELIEELSIMISMVK